MEKSDQQIKHGGVRDSYYTFAHVALRKMVEIDPLECFKIMTSKNQHKFIDFVWKEVCDSCHCDEINASKGILLSPTNVGRHPAVIIEMPPTKAESEAIYIAVVLRNPMDLDAVSDADYRYFLLEQGRATTAGSATVLCEWCDSGHYNMEEGPQADLKAFVKSVTSHI
ncbi:MAG: hypothetical protein HRT88_11870 [Lentisphaeraceae bacterium]|nr:hypothetical protein [Lentisphaeraceae bacterium]